MLKKNISHEDKAVLLGKTNIGLKGQKLPFPIIFEVTERYIKKGQRLVFLEIEVDTYLCSLHQLDAEEVIFL
jgi:hypothetical protein